MAGILGDKLMQVLSFLVAVRTFPLVNIYIVFKLSQFLFLS